MVARRNTSWILLTWPRCLHRPKVRPSREAKVLSLS